MADGHALSILGTERGVELGVVCNEPPGAPCRMSCADRGCDIEEYHFGDGGHELTDSGRCLWVEWIDECDVMDCYDHNGGGGKPLHDGMQVTVEWNGDVYVWRGAEVAVDG